MCFAGLCSFSKVELICESAPGMDDFTLKDTGQPKLIQTAAHFQSKRLFLLCFSFDQCAEIGDDL